MAGILAESLEKMAEWQSQWPAWEPAATLAVPPERLREVLDELLVRLRDNYPFWHPSYAGQMIKPPHPVATLAYFLTQQINPNNHALDGGPATGALEKEVVADLAGLFGFGNPLGHLTSSGTIANLEALWVARELAPGKAIAFSREAHYTHRRMAEVLGVEGVEIAADRRGRLDPDDLRRRLREGTIATVVATLGTTGVGAVDPLPAILELRREFDFRIHVDGAYGGFFRLLAETPGLLDPADAAAFRAISECDSVVVDPHKHGLQPYGCGSVIFRDPAVGALYKHDSPYTYFTSAELHLGEISLECSRAGAAAAALWATLKCFPLRGAGNGLGAILSQTREAAQRWAALIKDSGELELLLDPALDIITFYAVSRPLTTSGISRITHEVFQELMDDPRHPVYLAKFNAAPGIFHCAQPLVWDTPSATIFRSVLLKPEHADYVPVLHRRVIETLAGRSS
ncbi:MAG: pyridoxal phosphate-dependent decarboxylase family protein [Acidobacteriota bacterium]